jgi:hypothetical protein
VRDHQQLAGLLLARKAPPARLGARRVTHALARRARLGPPREEVLRLRGRGHLAATIRDPLGRTATRATLRRRVDPVRMARETPAAPVRVDRAKLGSETRATPHRRVDRVGETSETPAVPVHAVLTREASEKHAELLRHAVPATTSERPAVPGRVDQARR